MIKFVIFAIFVRAAVGTNFHIHECAGIPLPTDFRLEECPHGDPCNLHIGQTVNAITTLKFDKEVTSLSKVTGFVGPSGEVVYQHVSGTVCEQMDGGCPVKAGEHTFKESYKLEGEPNVPYTIVETIRDQDDNAIACFTILDKFISG